MTAYNVRLVLAVQDALISADKTIRIGVSHWSIFNAEGYYIKPVNGPKWVAKQMVKEMIRGRS